MKPTQEQAEKAYKLARFRDSHGSVLKQLELMGLDVQDEYNETLESLECESAEIRLNSAGKLPGKKITPKMVLDRMTEAK